MEAWVCDGQGDDPVGEACAAQAPSPRCTGRARSWPRALTTSILQSQSRRMLDKFTKLSPELYEYVLAHRSERDPVLAALIEETGKLGGWSMMQISPEQGAFLTLLARIMGAKSAVEVGTFTGY